MENQGLIIGKHIPFERIDGEFCRVVNILPMAKIDPKGVVRSMSSTMPYAVLSIESPNLPKEISCFYYVINKEDFRHVYEAHKQMDPSAHEIIIVYQNNPYKYQRNIWLKLLKNALPKLHVFIYEKGGLEKLYDPGKGEAGVRERMKMRVKEWKPMEGYSD